MKKSTAPNTIQMFGVSEIRSGGRLPRGSLCLLLVHCLSGGVEARCVTQRVRKREVKRKKVTVRSLQASFSPSRRTHFARPTRFISRTFLSPFARGLFRSSTASLLQISADIYRMEEIGCATRAYFCPKLDSYLTRICVRAHAPVYVYI